MCVIIAINQIGFTGLLPVLPLYAQTFGVSTSAIGMTIAVYGLARLVIAMPSGRLADGLGRRPTLALGGLLSTIGNLWCALAQSFPEFMVARFVAGAGAGIVITLGTVILADISTPSRRGRMMAIYQGTFLFAVGFGPLPGGLLAERFGLAMPFHAYAVAAFAVTLLAWFAIPETRAFGRPIAGDARSAAAVPYLEQVRGLMRARGFRLISLLGLAQAVVRTGAIFNVVPLLAATQLGLTTGEVGIAFAIGSVLGLAVVYPSGVLADRFGRKPVIVPAALLVGVTMAAFCFASTFAGFLLACALWSVASSVGGAAPSAYAADSAPPGMNAAAMSTYRMLSDLGYVIGPIGLGLVMDLVGAQTTLLAAGWLIAAVALWFALRAPETHPRAVRAV